MLNNIISRLESCAKVSIIETEKQWVVKFLYFFYLNLKNGKLFGKLKTENLKLKLNKKCIKKFLTFGTFDFQNLNKINLILIKAGNFLGKLKYEKCVSLQKVWCEKRKSVKQSKWLWSRVSWRIMKPRENPMFHWGYFLSKILNLSIIMFERITKDEQL